MYLVPKSISTNDDKIKFFYSTFFIFISIAISAVSYRYTHFLFSEVSRWYNKLRNSHSSKINHLYCFGGIAY